MATWAAFAFNSGVNSGANLVANSGLPATSFVTGNHEVDQVFIHSANVNLRNGNMAQIRPIHTSEGLSDPYRWSLLTGANADALTIHLGSFAGCRAVLRGSVGSCSPTTCGCGRRPFRCTLFIGYRPNRALFFVFFWWGILSLG